MKKNHTITRTLKFKNHTRPHTHTLPWKYKTFVISIPSLMFYIFKKFSKTKPPLYALYNIPVQHWLQPRYYTFNHERQTRFGKNKIIWHWFNTYIIKWKNFNALFFNRVQVAWWLLPHYVHLNFFISKTIFLLHHLIHCHLSSNLVIMNMAIVGFGHPKHHERVHLPLPQILSHHQNPKDKRSHSPRRLTVSPSNTYESIRFN